MKNSFKCFFILLMVCSLTACVVYDFSRPRVQQGNLLTAAKVDKLHHGMTKQSVAKLMGTSLLSSMFSADRWDYSYTLKVKNKPLEVKHLVLYFSNNQLKKIDKLL